MFHRQRRREEEWMDRPGVNSGELNRSLRFIRTVNRWLGYTRATVGHLARFSKSWKPGERIEILDLATGSADIPLAIARWGRQRGFDLRITAVDFHEQTLATARQYLAAAPPDDARRIELVRGDVFALPFAAESFDYVLTNMFLHHLDETQAQAVLEVMTGVARRGIVVADLLRSYRAYAWVTLMTSLASPMVRHDARVSVGQAFTREEILRLRDRAGLGFVQYYRHFGHRFVLAGEKRGR